MIDTIKLNIPADGYAILEQSRFKHLSDNGFDRYVQNPKPEEQLLGYKPNLTQYERSFDGKDKPLMIEFSIPKLLYGNNADEVVESDFETIISTLKERLGQMGVKIWEHRPVLESAKVSKADYAKNIILDDYTTASMVLNDLGKINLNKRLEFNKRHFQNGGHAQYLDCNSFQIVFYDKIADLNKTKRHRVDKNPLRQQQLLFSNYDKIEKPKELLRYEIRLSNAKLKSLLREIGFTQELTFKNLFNRDLSRQILQYYWQKFITDEAYILNLLNDKPELTLNKIKENAKRQIPVKDSLALLGISVLAKEFGMRGLRSAIESNYTSRTWFRLRDGFIKKNLIENITSYDSLKQITEALDKFEPVHLADLGLNEFDNVKQSKVLLN